MKKIAILICLTCVYPTFCFAQQWGGIKGGLNLAKEKATGSGISVTSDALTAPHFGLFYVSPITEQVGIQIETVYSVEGGKALNIEDKFSYMNVPVLLRLQAGRIINFHFGPQLGFLIVAKTDGQDITDELKAVNFSGAFGMALETDIGLSLGARYVLGLTDISRENIGAEYKLNTIQIWAGIRLFGQ